MEEYQTTVEIVQGTLLFITMSYVDLVLMAHVHNFSSALVLVRDKADSTCQLPLYIATHMYVGIYRIYCVH